MAAKETAERDIKELTHQGQKFVMTGETPSGIAVAGWQDGRKILRLDQPVAGPGIALPHQPHVSGQVFNLASLHPDQPSDQPLATLAEAARVHPNLAIQLPSLAEQKQIAAEQILTAPILKQKLKASFQGKTEVQQQKAELRRLKNLLIARDNPLTFLSQILQTAATEKTYSPELSRLAKIVTERSQLLDLIESLRLDLVSYSNHKNFDRHQVIAELDLDSKDPLIRAAARAIADKELNLAGSNVLDWLDIMFNAPSQRGKTQLIPSQHWEKIWIKIRDERQALKPGDPLIPLYDKARQYLHQSSVQKNLIGLSSEALAMMADVIANSQTDLAMTLTTQEVLLAAFSDLLQQWWQENWQNQKDLETEIQLTQLNLESSSDEAAAASEPDSEAKAAQEPMTEEQIKKLARSMLRPKIPGAESILMPLHRQILKFGLVSPAVGQRWFDLVEHSQLKDLSFMAETALMMWQNDQTNHPLFYQLMQELAIKAPNSEVVRQHEELRQRVMANLRLGPDWLLQNLPKLLVLAEKLVTIPRPGQAEFKLGFDLEFDAWDGTNPPRDVSVGPDSSLWELRRAKSNLAFTASYRAELADLSLWLADHATRPRSLHYHFDQKQALGIATGPSLGGLHHVRNNGLGTFENRSVILPVDKARLSSATIAAVIDLLGTANQNLTQVWQPVDLPGDQTFDWRQATWGQILRTTDDLETRLAGLLALKHHMALNGDMAHPEAFLRTFTPATIAKLEIIPAGKNIGQANTGERYENLERFKAKIADLWQDFSLQTSNPDESGWVLWLAELIETQRLFRNSSPDEQAKLPKSKYFGDLKKNTEMTNILAQSLLAQLPVPDVLLPTFIKTIATSAYRSEFGSYDVSQLVNMASSREAFYLAAYGLMEGDTEISFINNDLYDYLSQAETLPEAFWQQVGRDLADPDQETKAVRTLHHLPKIPEEMVLLLMELIDKAPVGHKIVLTDVLAYKRYFSTKIISLLTQRLRANPDQSWILKTITNQIELPAGTLESLLKVLKLPPVYRPQDFNFSHRLYDFLNELTGQIKLNSAERKLVRGHLISWLQAAANGLRQGAWRLVANHQLADQLNLQSAMPEIIANLNLNQNNDSMTANGEVIAGNNEAERVAQALTLNQDLLTEKAKFELLLSPNASKRLMAIAAISPKIVEGNLAFSNTALKLRAKYLLAGLNSDNPVISRTVLKLLGWHTKEPGNLLIKPTELLKILPGLEPPFKLKVLELFIVDWQSVADWSEATRKKLPESSLLKTQALDSNQIDLLISLLPQIAQPKLEIQLIRLLQSQTLSEVQNQQVKDFYLQARF